MTPKKIYKANALIEAGYRLTVAEHRIILAVIAQVRRDSPLTDSLRYRIYAQDIAERAGITRQAAYMSLKEAADRLLERILVVPYGPEGKRPSLRKFHWVQECVYSVDEGCVEVRLSKPILPYLADLSERFTVYQLNDVIRMNSSHAIRLYELLAQWKGLGEREVEVDWLKRSFQLEGKYKAMKDFKSKVIEPAVKEINEHSPLEVKWDQRKTGRRVTHLRFTFSSKDEATPKKPAKKPTAIPKALLDKFRQPGDSDEKAAQRVRAARQAAEG